MFDLKYGIPIYSAYVVKQAQAASSVLPIELETNGGRNNQVSKVMDSLR